MTKTAGHTRGANEAAMLIYGRLEALAKQAGTEPGAFAAIEDIIAERAVAPLVEIIRGILTVENERRALMEPKPTGHDDEAITRWERACAEFVVAVRDNARDIYRAMERARDLTA